MIQACIEPQYGHLVILNYNKIDKYKFVRIKSFYDSKIRTNQTHIHLTLLYVLNLSFK